MRLVPTKTITPEMTLAKPVYYNENIILNTGINNLYSFKKRLADLGINYVYINDEKSEGIIVNDIIRDETRQKSRGIIKETFSDIVLNRETNLKVIKNIITELIDDILNAEIIMSNLVDIKSYDSYTFEHSVNVAVLSILIAKSMDYNYNQLLQVGIGAILHDIGKILVPQDLIQKSCQLTEEEFNIVKEHVHLGYDYLTDRGKINPVSRLIVLSHHERNDGSGYPQGLTADAIHRYAKITAIADVFDALTSDRIYRQRWSIRETVTYLLSNTDQFEYEIVNNFVKKVALYPNGTLVLLNNGWKAIVRSQNYGLPERPVIRVVEYEPGQKIVNPPEINLLDEPELIIDNTYF